MRFISADTIVPDPANPQSWNRYSYGLDNPVKYTDPSGHMACDGEKSSEVTCTQATPREKLEADGATLIEKACSEPGMHCNPSAGEMLAFTGSGLILSALGTPEIIGAGLDAVSSAASSLAASATSAAQQLALKVATSCANNPVCLQIAWKILNGNLGSERAFWAGGSVAQSAAEASGIPTLGETVIGRLITAITQGVDYITQAKPLWDAASRVFAEGASGEVNVFQNALGVGANSIWAAIEYPTLMLNPNVTYIIYHIVMPDGRIVTP